MDIARETIELGDCDRTAQRARLGERRRQLRPAVQRVAPLASFNLDKLGDNLEALTRSEPMLVPPGGGLAACQQIYQQFGRTQADFPGRLWTIQSRATH